MKTTLKPITFNNKETYLAWRGQWKAEYRGLSQSIRETKAEIKEMMRNGRWAGGQQWQLSQLRSEATERLELLKTAKAEAQQQYLAARSVSASGSTGHCPVPEGDAQQSALHPEARRMTM